MELTELKFQRGQIKSKITRLKNFMDSIELGNDLKVLDMSMLGDMEARLKKAEPLLEQYEHLQHEIEFLLIGDASLPTEESKREEFENIYFKYVGKLKKIITCNTLVERDCSQVDSDRGGSVAGSTRSSNESHNQVSHENNSVNQVQDEQVSVRVHSDMSQVKLPTIKLPTFDGSIDKWVEFRDAFIDLIHDNNTISNFNKFHHLKSALQGEAAEVIQGIKMTAANYPGAWQLVVETFENNNLGVFNHVKSIFEQPVMKRENYNELRSLYINMTKNLRSLKALDEAVEGWDTLLIYSLASKFDPITLREWEGYKYESNRPTMNDMNMFLSHKCNLLQKLEYKHESKSEKRDIESKHNKRFEKRSKEQFNSYVNTNTNKVRCYFCKGEHLIYNCENLLKIGVSERIKQIQGKKLCLNCLRPGHSAKECSHTRCKKCNRSHNTLLHIDNNNNNASINSENSTVPENVQQTITSHALNNSEKDILSQVLLTTAIILVKDSEGQFHNARVLLDNGSQSNFITEELCARLKLNKRKINYSIKGVGQSMVGHIDHFTSIEFKSANSRFQSEMSCLILPNITDQLPTMTFKKSELEIPPQIQLADPNFYRRSKIDILIGSSLFWQLLSVGQIQLGKGKPTLQKTLLGWVVSGNITWPSQGSYCSFTSLAVQSEDTLSNQIARFWQLEECDSSKRVMSYSDKFCEEHFVKNIKRDSHGRFIVKIPLRENFNQLGDSRSMALERFYTLEKKLTKNDNLKDQYVSFMQEYESLGHMTKINELHSDYDVSYYLPHHAVVKDSSLTTKVRVVFDASAKSSSSLSLNNVQHHGPTIQSDLFSILLRFRQHSYVISADISKMYRQVLIDEDQRSLQRVFWRENPYDELQCFQLNTVTYGTASAPFLAVRCLLQLALENEATSPRAAEIIKSDFYVDDLLTGSNSVDELLKIQGDVSNILRSAGFELRKWLTNKPELFDKFCINDNLSAGVLHLGQDESNKTLGIFWNSHSDTIQYSLNRSNENFVTKRVILSITSQIFDPLGLLAPITIQAKLILQQLWQAGISWDEAIPQGIYSNWISFKDNLILINQLRIPRFVLSTKPISIELHAFSDASQKAYGACVYIRCLDASGTYTSRLLTAKTRVAPLKQISLPRLELCGANLLAVLVKKVTDSVTLTFSKKYYWCDSTITLGWIRAPANKWKTFVANRVGDIQYLTNPSDWYHVKSDDNPADLLSKGIDAKDLLKSKLWWHGPNWLLVDKSKWNPQTDTEWIDNNLPEQRAICSVSIRDTDFRPFEQFSHLLRLQRVVAYCLRFFKNLKLPKNERQFGTLTSAEMNNALNTLIKLSQIECFPKECNVLKNNKPIHKGSSILSLNPFFDSQQIIRVGGRMKHSDYDFNKKHPIILPANHKLTKLILKNEHERLFHCGPQQLLASIREKFWPISGRSIARKLTRNCVICFRAKPKPSQYLMGNLPKSRISQYFPFFNVGIDYSGPVFIKDRKLRGAKLVKAYICVFVCMSVKAIHLDLVTDLSTDAFLACLKRFVARRGRPGNIYSDNGTNFVGANSQLMEMYDFLRISSDTISDYLTRENINWHFIPARSPNFGGLWEAGVKSAKFHLKRIVGNLQLTYEDFLTILIQIEGILNSRPLTPLSSDPSDDTPLTPAHFLIGKSISTIPEPNTVDVPESRLNKFQKQQQVVQQFWKRWHNEYVSELQSRTKWKEAASTSLKLGDLVLLKDENLPPLKWALGRVTQLHPGDDNITRVVTIKLSGGNEVRRAISKVCALPVDPDNDSELKD